MYKIMSLFEALMQRVKDLRVLLPLLVVLSALLSQPSQAQTIRNYVSQLKMTGSGVLDVVEDIDIDLEEGRRDRILRAIPLKYVAADGQSHDLEVRLHSIICDRPGQISYTAMRHGSDFLIRIVDASVSTVRDSLHSASDANSVSAHMRHYRINYSVLDTVSFLSNRARFRFDVTGHDWTLPVDRLECVFYPPPGVGAVDLSAERSTAADERCRTWSNQDGSVALSTQHLAPGESLIISADLPVSALSSSPLARLSWWLLDWWPAVVLPCTVALALSLIYWHSGRDEGNVLITPQWTAPGELSPAEVGTLVDERCDVHDVISTLVDLAGRGYLKITQEVCEHFITLSNRNFIFTKLDAGGAGAATEALLPHEKKFLAVLFPGDKKAGDSSSLLELKEKFYTDMAHLQGEVYNSLVDRGLFRENPDAVRKGYYAIALAAVFIGSIVLLIDAAKPTAVGFLLSAAVTALFAPAMPARTARGCEQMQRWLSFEKFMKTEKAKLRETAANNPEAFTRALPYAIVLGAGDQWAEAFRDFMAEPPPWYEPLESGPGQEFSTTRFVSDLGAGLRTIERVFVSRPAGRMAESQD